MRHGGVLPYGRRRRIVRLAAVWVAVVGSTTTTALVVPPPPPIRTRRPVPSSLHQSDTTTDDSVPPRRPPWRRRTRLWWPFPQKQQPPPTTSATTADGNASTTTLSSSSDVEETNVVRSTVPHNHTSVEAAETTTAPPDPLPPQEDGTSSTTTEDAAPALLPASPTAHTTRTHHTTLSVRRPATSDPTTTTTTASATTALPTNATGTDLPAPDATRNVTTIYSDPRNTATAPEQFCSVPQRRRRLGTTLPRRLTLVGVALVGWVLPSPLGLLRTTPAHVARRIRSPLAWSPSRTTNPAVPPLSSSPPSDNDSSTVVLPSTAYHPARALSSLTDAVDKVRPCVVRIDTETIHERTTAVGQGSGVLVDDTGLVLTNAHVVADATRVTVTLADGQVWTGVVTGSDECTDLACLRLVSPDGTAVRPPSSLPVVEWGDSDQCQVGRLVLAVGSPGGLDQSVTMGIVSGLARSSTLVGLPHQTVDYIQTDAAINPGNSGGPLVDVETGTVVGITAAIRAHMEGTSFAIPSNRVRASLDDLAAGRPIPHGYLGVALATWSPPTGGALVHGVFPESPAARGGVRVHDVVVAIGGHPVATADEARRLIDAAPVGRDLTITVVRGTSSSGGGSGTPQRTTVVVQPTDWAARLRTLRQSPRGAESEVVPSSPWSTSH